MGSHSHQSDKVSDETEVHVNIPVTAQFQTAIKNALKIGAATQ